MLKKGCITLGLAILLSGCATAAPVPADAWNRWVCDNHTPVLWRPAGEDALDLRLGGDDIAHRLRRVPSDSGVLYRDEILAFHLQGEEGSVYRVATDAPIGRGCKAP